MASRSRRRWPWIVLVVLLALLALAWWFPARWAWSMVRSDYPTVQVETVAGSVWDGRARGLVVNGQRLGRLHWTLSRMAVFGRLRGQIDLDGAGIMVDGHVARTGDDAIVARDLHFSVPMERLKVLWPVGTPLGGTLEGQVAEVRLVDGWPVQLQAHVAWQSAQAEVQGRRVMLGELESRWSAPGGSVIQADLTDAGNRGPLDLEGRFVATALGWRLQATLRSRRAEPGLRRLLDRYGQRQSDGSVRIERHGGLAMAER